MSARLTAFGAATTRRMFGGFDVYFDGLMIALIPDGVSYLKAHDGDLGKFQAPAWDSSPTSAATSRSRCPTGRCPDMVFEDSFTLADGAAKPHQTARRGKRKKAWK